MESQSSRNLLLQLLAQMITSCHYLLDWNRSILTIEDYTNNSRGMEKLAASCMYISTLGETVKKIDKIAPGFLVEHASNIPWKNIKGLRDHIAHGYFDLDAAIIYDAIKNEVPLLEETLLSLYSRVESEFNCG